MAPTLQLPAASRALAAPRRLARAGRDAPRRRAAAAPTALAIPDHYGYVALSVGSAAVLNQYLAVRVALARRDAAVAYPAMIAEGTSEAANVFNCTQRAHQNTLGEFSCFLEVPVEAENSQPTNQSLTDNYRNENCRPLPKIKFPEYLPTAIGCQIVMGLQFPISAGALGAAWTLGRCAFMHAVNPAAAAAAARARRFSRAPSPSPLARSLLYAAGYSSGELPLSLSLQLLPLSLSLSLSPLLRLTEEPFTNYQSLPK